MLTWQRELVKVTNGIKLSENKEREFADALSEIEQADNGADLAELRNVYFILASMTGLTG